MSMFRQKIKIFIDSGRYFVKTIETAEELKEVLTLRYSIFFEELMNKKNFFKEDKDKFDNICDHLVIVEKTTNKIVGTYRVNCSLFSKKFYSANEFNIKNILKQTGVKVELGRACIQQEHRKNAVIILLWRGIVEYVKETNAKYLFGVSSAKELNEERIVELFYYFKQNHYSENDLRVVPKISFKISKLNKKIQNSFSTNMPEVPGLIKFYLKAGSKICGEPAHDRKMKCYDFFTILDMSKISTSVEEKFLK